MKQLVCEMCGSNDLVKQDGVFVCQSCGCKYSVEEAKKMMVEGTVEVTGTVKVDKSEETQKFLQLASRSRISENNEDAAKYYEMVLIQDPNNWEATFYYSFCKAKTCKISEIKEIADSFEKSFDNTIQLMKSQYDEIPEGDTKVVEITNNAVNLAELLFDNAWSYVKGLPVEYSNKNLPNLFPMILNSNMLIYHIGDTVSVDFINHEEIEKAACTAWETGLKKQLLYENGRYGRELKPIQESYQKKLKSYNDMFIKRREKEQAEKENVRKKRIEQYWSEHLDEKYALETELTSINDELSILSSKEQSVSSFIDALKKAGNQPVPAACEIQKLELRQKDLEEESKKLGLFQGKKKAAIAEQIAQIGNDIKELTKEKAIQEQQRSTEIYEKSKVPSVELGKIQKDIKTIKTRKAMIVQELSKDR